MLDAWETVISNPDKCAGEIFCIGPDNAIKIKDYVKLIADKIIKKSPLTNRQGHVILQIHQTQRRIICGMM